MKLLMSAVVLALALIGSVGVISTSAIGDKEQVGSSPQQPLAVSLVRLIATPQAFDGKYVQVMGFVSIEHEGTAIYLHRDDWQHMVTKNGIWLVVSDIPSKDSPEEKVNERYALIEGRFVASNHGHRDLWSGAIEKVTRMIPWESRKGAK
jgi:hypothetical protein